MTDDTNDHTPNANGERAPAPRGRGKPKSKRRKGKDHVRMAGKGTSLPRLPRHQARTLALQALYEYDLTGHERDRLARVCSTTRICCLGA